MVSVLDRLVKIKRLEVGESTQNVDVHSKQTKDLSYEEATQILNQDFIEAEDVE